MFFKAIFSFPMFDQIFGQNSKCSDVRCSTEHQNMMFGRPLDKYKVYLNQVTPRPAVQLLGFWAKLVSCKMAKRNYQVTTTQNACINSVEITLRKVYVNPMLKSYSRCIALHYGSVVTENKSRFSTPYCYITLLQNFQNCDFICIWYFGKLKK